jgi:hypothetical protein
MKKKSGKDEKTIIPGIARLAGAFSMAALAMSCSHEGKPVEIAVDGFPVEEVMECGEGRILDIPSTGIMEINIAGDMLVVSTGDMRDAWQTYSLPEVALSGSLFSVGGGPGELLMPTPGIAASFYSRGSDGHTMCIIPSTMNGRFIAGDLTTHSSTDTVINNTIGPTTVMAYRLGGLGWFNTEIIPDSCKLRRSIVAEDGTPVANAAMSALNEKSVGDMSQMPQIMFRPVIKPDGSWIAEVPGFTPVIEVWNTSTGESFRIRYTDGDTAADEKSRLEANKPMFGGGVAFDDFFALQRYGDDGTTHIDFFGWDGTARATLSLTCSDIRRIGIDIKNGDLYCLDADKDAIVRFDIADFLTKID